VRSPADLEERKGFARAGEADSPVHCGRLPLFSAGHERIARMFLISICRLGAVLGQGRERGISFHSKSAPAGRVIEVLVESTSRFAGAHRPLAS